MAASAVARSAPGPVHDRRTHHLGQTKSSIPTKPTRPDTTPSPDAPSSVPPLAVRPNRPGPRGLELSKGSQRIREAPAPPRAVRQSEHVEPLSPGGDPPAELVPGWQEPPGAALPPVSSPPIMASVQLLLPGRSRTPKCGNLRTGQDYPVSDSWQRTGPEPTSDCRRSPPSPSPRRWCRCK